MVSGVFLAMYYTPEKNLAFDSVERIMREALSRCVRGHKML